MRFLILLTLLLVPVPLAADGPRSFAGPHDQEAGGPWLGIHTKRMEKATAAQLNDVPEGFGVLVDQVAPDSPASDAGLQSLDVLWKYNDQFIANRGQLYALIMHTGIGKEAALTISRRGENIVVSVRIGVRPDSYRELAEAATEVLMPPLPGSIVRQLDLGKRSGFIAEGNVTVRLSRHDNGFEFSVSEGEELVKEGVLAGKDISSWPATIDDKTRRKLKVLFDSLENAEQREAPAPRIPRVRRVPVPQQKP